MTTITFKSTIDVHLKDHMGGDDFIVAAALVSIKGTQAEELSQEGGKYSTPEKKFGLLNYLMKHRHGTPFEHSAATFFVHAPIFVWREWHRHRIGFSYNEESARYKQLDPIFYIPWADRPMLKPTEEWKPGRPKFLKLTTESDFAKFEKLIANLKDDYTRSYAHYEENLAMGFDPGLARDGLNFGIYSGCYVTCNPRSMMAFLSLRTHDELAKFVSYPLYEIEQAALGGVEEALSRYWPITYKAFCENGRVGP